MTIGLNELQHIHQLRPETSVTTAPLTVSQTAPAQMEAKCGPYDIDNVEKKLVLISYLFVKILQKKLNFLYWK